MWWDHLRGEAVYVPGVTRPQEEVAALRRRGGGREDVHKSSERGRGSDGERCGELLVERWIEPADQGRPAQLSSEGHARICRELPPGHHRASMADPCSARGAWHDNVFSGTIDAWMPRWFLVSKVASSFRLRSAPRSDLPRVTGCTSAWRVGESYSNGRRTRWPNSEDWRLGSPRSARWLTNC